MALIERERAAIRDTGHTTARLTYVTDTGLDTLQKKFGADHAEAVWDAGAAAIDEIEEIVIREAVDCEFARVPGYLHVPIDCDSEDDNQELKKVACLAQQFGFEATFLESIPHFGVAGIRFADQARFHPRKYLAHLIRMIPGNRSHVFEETAAGKFDAKRRRVKANGHWITFDRVAILTNNPLVGFASVTSATLFQTKLSLSSSYVLGASIPRGALPLALFWDTKNPYDYYLRVHPRTGFDYAIFAGEDQKTGQGQTPTRCYDRLLVRLKKIVPEAQIEHRWSGQVIETNDGLPVIGENADRQFIATGFCGNGITFGTISAMMARDWATGAKNPWTELFAADRKMVRAPWDYLKENKDYPYYFVKGRLQRAEADSVLELKRGAGMIVKSKSGKLAAYRDSKGTVHTRSAVCPHMGCIVRWNEAEKTWDCPCHGSRFKATGEVIAGPAESGLASP